MGWFISKLGVSLSASLREMHGTQKFILHAIGHKQAKIA